MKIIPAFFMGGLLFAASLPAHAKTDALHYKFSTGETNAFAVAISVRSETGFEVTTGNVIFVTGTVTTNTVTLSCRGNLKADSKHLPQHGQFYSGFYPGYAQGISPFPDNCELELDATGQILRDGGDYLLAAPLGKLAQSIFEPLPAKSGTTKSSDTTAVMDEPLWLGPASSFFTSQPYSSPFYVNYYPRPSFATIILARNTSWNTVATLADTIKLHKQISLQSILKTGTDPRLKANCESDFVFDKAAGLLANIETKGEIVTLTETTSRKAEVTFSCRRLTGTELVAALAPPVPAAPPTPRTLTDSEVAAIIADLKSSDDMTRKAAMRKLNGVRISTPSAELVDLVTTNTIDSDSFIRSTAANFLNLYGSSDQVPVLLKLLRDTDYSTQQAAIHALGKLKDERSIEPLAGLVARGSTSSIGEEAINALKDFGPVAEGAVRQLLAERNLETERQACNILQQIGTSQSLDALQKLAGDNDQGLSQSAVEAIRGIRLRQ